jgi:hypothetical protein
MRGQAGSIDKEFACAETVLMQTKRGGTHDIMPVGLTTATTSDRLFICPAMPMRTGALAAT